MPVLTPDALEAKFADQPAQLAPWRRQAAELIAGKLADAEAHARNAITDTLRDATPGRRTLAKARRSRSFQAATVRLGELLDGLLALVADARAAFYSASLASWVALLPADVQRPRRDDPSRPTAGSSACIRSATVHGRTPNMMISPSVRAARDSLLAAIAFVGNRGVGRRAEGDALATWRKKYDRAMTGLLAVMLADSLGLADRMAGRDAIRPELLHDDPTIPGG